MVYLTSCTVVVVSGDIKNKKNKKKQALKMTSSLVIFRAFLFLFFLPPTLNLKKNSRKSTKKNWPDAEFLKWNFPADEMD